MQEFFQDQRMRDRNIQISPGRAMTSPAHARAPQQSWLLSLNEQGRARVGGAGHSAAWRDLDVSIAPTLILEELLHLQPEDLTAGKYVAYTHEEQIAMNAVEQGKAQAALFLNATRVRQICDIADADDQMPQKSTYFYPKLITGLVMNPLW